MQASFANLQLLVETLKTSIAHDPKHRFLLTQRLQLYEFSGNLTCFNSAKEEAEHIQLLKEDTLTLTLADKIYAWLSILSVKKVAHAFEMGVLSAEKRATAAYSDIDSLNKIPAKIIEVAEQTLLGTAETSVAWGALNNEFHYAGDTIYRVYDYSSVCIFEAACAALSIALGIIEYEGTSKSLYLQQSLKTSAEIVVGDSPAKAMAAFAAIDKTPSHLWNEWESRKYSASKKLEFWNWWLDEAVPQAWKLAQQ